MITHAKTERNWKIWTTYRAGGISQMEIARQFGITSSRIGDICNKLDRHLANALVNGSAAGEQGRDARAQLSELNLQLSDNPPYGPQNPARPWRKAAETIRNLWTFEPIPDTAGKYYRVVADRSQADLLMVKPKRFAEKPLAETPAPPINGMTKVKDLPLSSRTTNCLRNEGFETLAELLALGRPELEALLKAPNFGRKSLRELCDFLAHIKGQSETPDPEELQRRLQEATDTVVALRTKIKEQEAALQREYAFVSKLRGVLAKLTRDMSVGELRDAGVEVEMRVKKD